MNDTRFFTKHNRIVCNGIDLFPFTGLIFPSPLFGADLRMECRIISLQQEKEFSIYTSILSKYLSHDRIIFFLLELAKGNTKELSTCMGQG